MLQGGDRRCHSQDRRWNGGHAPWVPSPQLTSTICDLESPGLGNFLVSLGGGYSCSKRLHNFVEQLWSKVLLIGQEDPECRWHSHGDGHRSLLFDRKALLAHILRYRAEVGAGPLSHVQGTKRAES